MNHSEQIAKVLIKLSGVLPDRFQAAAKPKRDMYVARSSLLRPEHEEESATIPFNIEFSRALAEGSKQRPAIYLGKIDKPELRRAYLDSMSELSRIDSIEMKQLAWIINECVLATHDGREHEALEALELLAAHYNGDDKSGVPARLPEAMIAYNRKLINAYNEAPADTMLPRMLDGDFILSAQVIVDSQFKKSPWQRLRDSKEAEASVAWRYPVETIFRAEGTKAIMSVLDEKRRQRVMADYRHHSL